MKILKTFALACVFAISALFVSTAGADTVGCHKYKWHDTYESGHWEKVVKDLEMWTTKHQKYHPYYYTMKKKLADAEYNLKHAKYSHHGQKKHRKCKVDVSPS